MNRTSHSASATRAGAKKTTPVRVTGSVERQPSAHTFREILDMAARIEDRVANGTASKDRN